MTDEQKKADAEKDRRIADLEAQLDAAKAPEDIAASTEDLTPYANVTNFEIISLTGTKATPSDSDEVGGSYRNPPLVSNKQLVCPAGGIIVGFARATNASSPLIVAKSAPDHNVIMTKASTTGPLSIPCDGSQTDLQVLIFEKSV